MMFPGNGCCCDTPPPCRMFQVNAIKAHGGMQGNEAPWIGSWTSVAADNNATLQYIEANTLGLSTPFTWPQWSNKYACGTSRYLRYTEDGFSNHPVDLPPLTVVPIYWHAEIIWERKTGHVKSAVFTVNYNGGGDETYWSATLNQSTGEYTVVDNTATAHTPTWVTVDATGFSGGTATINLNEDGASYEYTIPDSGHGLGSTTQSLTIQLTERYDEGDVFGDAIEMLDAIDLGNISTGDSTGTFVPLEPNTEYTIGYTGWSPDLAVLERTYYQASALTSCTDNAANRRHFPPYISKLYGSKLEIYAALYGDTATFSGLHFPGRSMIEERVPAEPQTTGSWPHFPGPPSIRVAGISNLKYIFVSKLRASPDGEYACLASREQEFCSCEPLNIVDGWTCNDATKYDLTTVTDCDRNFYDPSSPANTCIAGPQGDICLNPTDMIFEWGVAILFPACRDGAYPDCAGMSIAPSCCN